ncbi:MAG: fimbrillin family protein, partial [Rikenellaceae bacterium]
MKRTKLTYLFAFALLLGSCTMDDVDTEELLEIDPMTDMSISISGTVNNDSATKGVVIEDEASLATMGVYSYMTPADVTWGNQTGTDVSSFFNDFNTTYPITATYSTDDGAWGYGYTRYWPSDGSLLHFYAWAPTERINRTYNSTDGYPEFYHTLSSNAIDNYDLMWSVPQVDLKYSDENKGKVEFDFTHALSRISLYARVYVSKAYSIEKEPTNILSYERFGINGITFYDVVGRADVEYDSNLNPSWKPTTTGSRVSITASQGNTLLEHYNSIRTTTGQVPKVDEDTVDDGELTYKSVMMTQTDDDGTEESTDTHGIFLFPQTFCVNETTTDPDSPDAYMRVRIRHYENWFVSATEARSIINEIDVGGSEYEGEYYDHIYCNEDLEIAVIYFDPSATGTTNDTDENSYISYVSKSDFLGESYSNNYLCVQKDQTGTLYTTSDLKLSDVFDNTTLFPNGGIEPAQHI